MPKTYGGLTEQGFFELCHKTCSRNQRDPGEKPNKNPIVVVFRKHDGTYDRAQMVEANYVRH